MHLGESVISYSVGLLAHTCQVEVAARYGAWGRPGDEVLLVRVHLDTALHLTLHTQRVHLALIIRGTITVYIQLRRHICGELILICIS